MQNYKEIELTQGYKAKVSIEDYEKVSRWKWKIHPQGYACRSAGSPKQGYRTILMHRFILNTPIGLETDHINQDKLDNRRENLRVVTRSENEYNKNPTSNNTSGCRGVVWDKNKKKWLVRVSKKHIGRYTTKQEAIKARIKALHEHT